MRVQWDRSSRPIRNADRAVLFIEDGTAKSQLDLTGRQLDGSSVKYWPESERVAFRLEVYRGGLSSSESTDFGMPQDWKRHRQAGPARAIVEQARPSPFEPTGPQMVKVQALSAPVMAAGLAAPELAAEAVAAPVEPMALPVEPAREGRLDRMISKIPLLRRLRKHPPADGSEPR